MAVLETTFLTDLLRGAPEIKELKDELDRTESSLAIAAPSIMELWSGIFLARLPFVEMEKANFLLQSLRVLPLDAESAKEAGEIEADLKKRGLIIQTEDIMIAAIARINGEKIITRDMHYARIPGIKVLKY